jgi:hypothetical protein
MFVPTTSGLAASVKRVGAMREEGFTAQLGQGHTKRPGLLTNWICLLDLGGPAEREHVRLDTSWPHGYETAVEGKNGFACVVERGWMAPFDNPEFWSPKIRGPLCFNPPAVRSILPLTYKRTEMVLAGQSKTQVCGGGGRGAKAAPGSPPRWRSCPSSILATSVWPAGRPHRPATANNNATGAYLWNDRVIVSQRMSVPTRS